MTAAITKPEFSSIREEIRFCAQNKVPFYESGERFSFDLVYNKELQAIRILDGDLVRTDATGKLAWTPVVGDIKHTINQLFRIDKDRHIDFVELINARPWLKSDEELMKREDTNILSAEYFNLVMFTIEGEAHNYE